MAKRAQSHDQSENDIGQLHKTISELTKELKDIKEIMKSNEKSVNSTRRVVLASPYIAANATQKPNEKRRRVLEEHEVYTPVTKRRRKAQDASENASALDTFGSVDCIDLFGK